MAITIHKVIVLKDDPAFNDGSKICRIILEDDVTFERRSSSLGGIPNRKNDAKVYILNKAEKLFRIGERINTATLVDIDSPQKEFIANLPSLTQALVAIDSADSLPAVRVILRKMVKAIYALKDMDS